MKTELITVGEYAMVYVWFLCRGALKSQNYKTASAQAVAEPVMAEIQITY